MQRNTIQRTLILGAVRSVTTHPTADDVYFMVSGSCPGISRATVYRVLGNLAKEGEIQRVGIAGAPDRFDLTVGPHAHCVCERCGKVFDIVLDRYPEISDNRGAYVSRISVTAYGLCRDCAEEDSSYDILHGGLNGQQGTF